MLKITVMNGPDDGRELTIAQLPAVIGHDPSCNVPVHFDEFASRQHAKIISKSGKVFIVDMGSTNGITLGELRVEGVAVLQPGDRIRVGNTQLKLTWEV